MADETDNIGINVNINPSGAETGGRRAAKAVTDVGKGAGDLQSAFRRLQQSIDPLYAAQEKYNKALADNRALFREGMIGGQEFAAGMKAAKQALDQARASIQANSAAGRQAAAELAAQRQKEIADAKAAAIAARTAARDKLNAERDAARQAAAEVRAAKQAEQAAIREAAAAAKAAAREKAAAERAATEEALAAERAAKKEEQDAARAAAAVAKQAAKDKANAEREAAAATRNAAEETRRAAIAERQQAQALVELRAGLDPLFAAQTRYNSTMQQATALLMQNKLQEGEWIAIQRQAKAQMDINQRSLGRMNTAYVQLGYQAQDVTASLASGINPLVILAQQGGQTAAALSTMGGVVGRVAAFMAGPWGAAIIGFTLLIGMLAEHNEKAKKKTLELTDAEAVRTASLSALTEALAAFNKEQEKANQNVDESNRLSQIAAQGARDRAQTIMDDLSKQLAAAQARLKSLESEPMSTSKGGFEAQQGTLYAARAQVEYLTEQFKKAQKAFRDAEAAITETRIPQIMREAEGATNGATAAQIEFNKQQTNLYNIYRQQMAKVNEIADAKKRSVAAAAAEKALQDGLTAAINKRTAAEKAWSDSQRTNTRNPGSM